MPVADEVQALALRSERHEQLENAGGRSAVGAVKPAARTGGETREPRGRARACAPMRGGVEPVDEPRRVADRRGHTEREVLRELEGLEMIEDDRLRQAASQMLQG